MSVRAVLLLGAALTCLPALAAAQSLQVQAARSHVEFGVHVLWFGKIIGVFDRLCGRVRDLGAGQVQVTVRVDARALRMDNARYVRFASGRDFFDSARWPLIVFCSQPFALATIGSGGKVGGEVTLRGHTHALDFEVLAQHCSALPALQRADAGAQDAPAAAASAPTAAGGTEPGAPPADAAACRVLARTWVRRSAFGMDGHSFIIGDRVELGLVLWLAAQSAAAEAPHDGAGADTDEACTLPAPAASGSVAAPANVGSVAPSSSVP